MLLLFGRGPLISMSLMGSYSILIFRELEYFQPESHLGVYTRLRLASCHIVNIGQFLIFPRTGGDIYLASWTFSTSEKQL